MRTSLPFGIVVAFALWLVWPPAAVLRASDDAFSKVSELYEAADYEGALAILERLDSNRGETTIARYRAFCLLALGRNDEARQAIARLIEADPTYRPLPAQTAPRILTAFRDVRVALLPQIARRTFAEAKAAFDKHEPGASARFDRVLTLLDDPDFKGESEDLRALALGFRDLSRAIATAPPSPVPETAAPTQAPRQTAQVSESAIAARPAVTFTGSSDTIIVSTKGAVRQIGPRDPPTPGLEPPIVLSQEIPRWLPRGAAQSLRFSGAIQVRIDDHGNVWDASLLRAIHPDFDGPLVNVARRWKYKPALLHGKPVAFVLVVEIQIEPTR